MEFNRVIIVMIIFIIVGFGILKMTKKLSFNKERDVYTIGIVQTASHPALDAVREGFVEAIKESVGEKINFVVRNGQSSISATHTIAQQFHTNDDIDGVFAIGTPAAQAMVTVEAEKPICIAAVSVMPDFNEWYFNKNVYGVNDLIDVGAEVALIKELLPQVKMVGIIYSTAEINSIAISKIMVAELEKIGLTPFPVGISTEVDIEPALMSALRKVDLLLAPTDNMIASSIALVTRLADKAGKPLIVSDNMLVKYGALMARGVDYYESGKQAGVLAAAVLVNGKNPAELSIVSADSREIFINKQVAKSFGVIIPDSIMHDVILV